MFRMFSSIIILLLTTLLSLLCIIIIIPITFSSAISVDSVLSCSKTKNTCYNLAYSCSAGSGCGTTTQPKVDSCDSIGPQVPSYFAAITPCTRNFLECLARVKNEILSSLQHSDSGSWEPECVSFALNSRFSLDARFPYQTVPVVCPFLSALSDSLPLSASSARTATFNASETSFQRFLEVSRTCGDPILNQTLYSPRISQYDCQCPILSSAEERKPSTSTLHQIATTIVGEIGMFRQVFFSESVFAQEYSKFAMIHSSPSTVSAAVNFNCSLLNSKQEEMLSAFDVALGTASGTERTTPTRYPVPIGCTSQCEFASTTFPSVASHPWLNFVSGSWAYPSWTLSVEFSSSSSKTTLASPQLPFLLSSNSTQVVKDYSSLSTQMEITRVHNFSFSEIPPSVLPLEFVGRLKWCDATTFTAQNDRGVSFSADGNNNGKTESATRKLTFFELSGDETRCLVTEPTTNECRCPENFGDDSDGFEIEVSSFRIQLLHVVPSSSSSPSLNRTLSMRIITFCKPATIQIISQTMSSSFMTSASESYSEGQTLSQSQQRFLNENNMPSGSAVMTNMTVTTWNRKISNSTFLSFELARTQLFFIGVPSQLPQLHRGQSGIALTVLLISPMVSYPVFPLVLGALSLASECNVAYQEIYLLGLQSFAPTSIRATVETKLESIRDYGGQLGFVTIVLVLATIACHWIVVVCWSLSTGPVDEPSNNNNNNNLASVLAKQQQQQQQQIQPQQNTINNVTSAGAEQKEQNATTDKSQSYSTASPDRNAPATARSENVVAFVEPQHERVEVQSYPTSSKHNLDAGHLGTAQNHHPSHHDQQQDEGNFLSRAIKKCFQNINGYFSQLPWASAFRNTLFPQLSGSILFAMLPFLTFLSIKAAVTIPSKSEQEKKKDEKVDPGVILALVICFFLWMILIRAVYKTARDNSFFYTSIKGMKASATSEWRVEECPDLLYIYYDDETLEYFDKKLSFLAGTPFLVPEGAWLSENEVIRAVAQMPEATAHEPLIMFQQQFNNSGLDDVVVARNSNSNSNNNNNNNNDSTSRHPLSHSPQVVAVTTTTPSPPIPTTSLSAAEGENPAPTASKGGKIMLTQHPSQQLLPIPTKVKKRMESGNSHVAGMNPFVKVNYYSKKKSSTSAMLKNQLFGGRGDSSINLHQLAAGSFTLGGIASSSDTQSNVSNKSHHMSSSRRRSRLHHHLNLGTDSTKENLINYKHYPGFFKTFAAMVSNARIFRCVIRPFKLKYSFLGPLIMLFLVLLMSILTAIPASMVDCSAVYLIEIIFVIIAAALTVAFRPFRSSIDNVFIAVCCLLTVFLARSCLSGVGRESMSGVFIAIVSLSGFGCIMTAVCSLTEHFIWEANLIERHLIGIANAAVAAAAVVANDSDSAYHHQQVSSYAHRIRNDPEDIQREQGFFWRSTGTGDDRNSATGASIATIRRKKPPVSQPLTPRGKHLNDPTGIVWIDDDDDDEIYEVTDRRGFVFSGVGGGGGGGGTSQHPSTSFLPEAASAPIAPSAAAVSHGFVPESLTEHQEEQEEMTKFQQQTKFKKGLGGEVSSGEDENGGDDDDDVTEIQLQERNLPLPPLAIAQQQQQDDDDPAVDETNKKQKRKKVKQQTKKTRSSGKGDVGHLNTSQNERDQQQQQNEVITDDDLHQTATMHSVGELSSTNTPSINPGTRSHSTLQHQNNNLAQNSSNIDIPRLVIPPLGSLGNHHVIGGSRGPSPIQVRVTTSDQHQHQHSRSTSNAVESQENNNQNNNNNNNNNNNLTVVGAATNPGNISRSFDGSSFRTMPSMQNQQQLQVQNNNNNNQQQFLSYPQHSFSRRPSDAASTGLFVNDDNVSNHPS